MTSLSRPAELDFETFSTAGYTWDPARRRWVSISKSPPHGIGAVGGPAYAEHPSTSVLCAAYDFHDGYGPRLWLPGMEPPQDLFDHIAAGYSIQAWNSQFEYWIWYHVCHKRMGWPALPLEQLLDGVPRAFAWGVPGALAKAGDAIKSPLQKDKDGMRLIRKFCMGRTPTLKDDRRRIMPDEDSEDGHKLYAYCIQDIASQSEITSRLPELSEFEYRLWLLDQQINARGVHIDVEALSACKAIVEQAHEKYNEELRTLTGCMVMESSKLQDLQKWLKETEGVNMPNMQKATIDDVLSKNASDPDGPYWLPPNARRALEIRQTLGGAAVKKLFAISNRLTTDNRLHGLFAFCGASRTGRWAGRGPQPQNLYRNCHDPDIVDDVLRVIKTRDIKVVTAAAGVADKMTSNEGRSQIWREWLTQKRWEYNQDAKGDPIETVAGCLRGLFCAAPGHDLICSDYSAIEAVVLAMLAGEQWRIDLFRRKGDIYSESAAKITGVPMPAQGPHPHRKSIGKVAELASGYQGWIGAWKNFGAEKHFSTDDEIKQAILKWREASPNIVEMWGGQLREDPRKRWDDRFAPEFYGVEGAAVSAIANPGHHYTFRLLSYIVEDDVLYCKLPSGRKLAYHEPRLEPGVDNYSKRPIWKISYMGYSDGQWKRLYTYGGKLTENVTQAAARDILAHAMLELDAAGYPIVLHVHDEAVAEVPHGWGSVEEFEKIMSMMPEWASDWPVRAAGGWRGHRYRKD